LDLLLLLLLLFPQSQRRRRFVVCNIIIIIIIGGCFALVRFFVARVASSGAGVNVNAADATGAAEFISAGGGAASNSTSTSPVFFYGSRLVPFDTDTDTGATLR
jgi:uncharacterized SAM-binding protein YcdF (DUF218 family)